jgi:hypothetical protein
MKQLRVILVAGSLLATLTTIRAEFVSTTAPESQQWLTHYYQNPRPDELLSSVHRLSREGYFESANQPATAIGFFSVVFAQNPHRITSWLARTSDLPVAHRRILAAAAWKAGHPAGARQLRELSAGVDSNLASEISELLAAGSVPVAQSPVLSQSSMDLQWGAFLASGDERNIVNVLAGLASDRGALSSSARYSLAQNAVAHPRVLEIVESQLDRQPEAIRTEIRAALQEASSTAKPGV